MSELEKPSNCNCPYPKLVARNMCGHAETCPAYAEWAMNSFLEKHSGMFDGTAGKTFHKVGSDRCEYCDNYFGDTRYPLRHSNAIAESKCDGRIHCEVTPTLTTGFDGLFVCDGCGWYNRKIDVFGLGEVRPKKFKDEVSDGYRLFRIEDFAEGGGVLIEATFLEERFELEVVNERGRPVSFTLREKSNQKRIRGKVKWFDVDKGYGFIERAGNTDLFVHFSDIQTEGFRALEAGDEVEYELGAGRKGARAIRISPVKKDAAGNS